MDTSVNAANQVVSVGADIAFFFFPAEDGIRVWSVTGVQTCALPISRPPVRCRVLVGLLALAPLTPVGPARAGTGCQVAPVVMSRTAEGLPKESGEASGFAASRR